MGINSQYRWAKVIGALLLSISLFCIRGFSQVTSDWRFESDLDSVSTTQLIEKYSNVVTMLYGTNSPNTCGRTIYVRERKQEGGPFFHVRMEDQITNGPPSVTFQGTNFTFRGIGVRGFPLSNTNVITELPTWNEDKAIEEAYSWMARFGQTIPTNWSITHVEYVGTGDYRYQWTVQWEPIIDGLFFDKFALMYPSCAVIIHETKGLVRLFGVPNFPEPTNYSLRVTSEVAIRRASSVASLVLKTPFFLMNRGTDHTIAGVKSVELKIAYPNWLLDPKRARCGANRDEIPLPNETRFCWIVTFQTWIPDKKRKFTDSKDDVLVYVDACTAEIVGADFR